MGLILLRVPLGPKNFIVIDWKHSEIRLFYISYETGKKKNICIQTMNWK